MKLKLVLALSLAMNLALGGAAVYFSQATAEQQSREKAIPAVVATASVAIPLAKRFSWSEVQSDSLMIYVDNLRAIGCPQDVILRIIRTDEPPPVAIGEGRQASPQSAPYTTNPVTNGGTGVGQAQNAPLVAGAGYVAPASNGVGATTAQNGPVGFGATPVSGGSAPVSSPRRTVTPLAWQDGGAPVTTTSPMAGAPPGSAPAAQQLTEAQVAGVNSVQDAFVDELNGTSQNANDPAYARQWNAAQQRADDRLRAMLGDAAFMQYQLNAARQGK